MRYLICMLIGHRVPYYPEIPFSSETMRAMNGDNWPICKRCGRSYIS